MYLHVTSVLLMADDDSSQLWQELSPTDLLSFARQAAIGMVSKCYYRYVYRGDLTKQIDYSRYLSMIISALTH